MKRNNLPAIKMTKAAFCRLILILRKKSDLALVRTQQLATRNILTRQDQEGAK